MSIVSVNLVRTAESGSFVSCLAASDIEATPCFVPAKTPEWYPRRPAAGGRAGAVQCWKNCYNRSGPCERIATSASLAERMATRLAELSPAEVRVAAFIG